MFPARRPTLVVLGAHNQAILAASALLAMEIPNAVHVVMPGLGHMTAIVKTLCISSSIRGR